MPTATRPQLTQFASDVINGLTLNGQKKLPPKYFYDDLGSKLFEAITMLPEYGLSRADSRVLARCAEPVARELGSPCIVAELGSGSGRKTSHILAAIDEPGLRYYPIDVSVEALNSCSHELNSLAAVEPIHADYFEGLAKLARLRPRHGRLLLLFVGSSIGNFEPDERHSFFHRLHESLRPGDLFLLGADLVKDPERMIAAYDDPTCVTAAFNLNLLARINRELDAGFNLRSFTHQALWNSRERRIEMHLVSCEQQQVRIRAMDVSIEFAAGESIWTESSHKFTQAELDWEAETSGFRVLDTWTDEEWPLVETLWQA
jgi:L-histidine N-alpha-methyltransferase